MTDFSRLLKLSGLITESIADDPHTNAEIEQRLDGMPEDMRTNVLDALEALKNAGPNGLTIDEWKQHLRTLNGDPEMPLKDVLVAAARKFNNVVHKIGDKRYAWIVSHDGDEFAPEMVQTLGNQVTATSQALALMHQMGDFTSASLAAKLSRDLRMPAPAAAAFAQHLIGSFSGSLEDHGGTYRMKPGSGPQTNSDSMKLFRDIAAKGGA